MLVSEQKPVGEIMAKIDLHELIPNNVGLSSDRRLQKALEKWQPSFLKWWEERGPEGLQADDIYLRTAISTQPGGWANFSYVKMPEYRWGIFLADAEENRVIPAGDHAGKPVWQNVPGEYRNLLKRLIVTQADTEPASVEQQRTLGCTAPSHYDLRNLLQVNVEEARHLWAMVYLLQAYFGKDGRDEADELLARHSGDADKPRILDAFNQPCTDWLSFFAFTMFMDRDGKYQLGALAESAFDPLSRTCRFMLTEEAHHLFVGETGLDRIIRRTAQLMKKDPNEDAQKQGGIGFQMIQKWINHWYAFTLDLYGAEYSTNAANAFSFGLKGRWAEAKNYTEHSALDQVYNLEIIEEGKTKNLEIPLRNAMNQVLRDDFAKDCYRALKRWNQTLASEGISQRLYLPHQRFFRRQGLFADQFYHVDGTPQTKNSWMEKAGEFLPTAADKEWIKELMKPVNEPGKMANWICPPKRGINRQPVNFEYVRKV